MIVLARLVDTKSASLGDIRPSVAYAYKKDLVIFMGWGGGHKPTVGSHIHPIPPQFLDSDPWPFSSLNVDERTVTASRASIAVLGLRLVLRSS